MPAPWNRHSLTIRKLEFIMKTLRHAPALAIASLGAVAMLAVAGCSSDSSTSTLASLYNDSTVTVDIAASAGDAISTSIENMAANEQGAGILSLSDLTAGTTMANSAPANALTTNRSRTCYDAAGAVVAGCTPLSTVRKIVSQVKIDGSRSSSSSTTGGSTASWSGAVHRVSNDTLVRVFAGATETQRIHTDNSVAHDTTSFSDDKVTRNVSEFARDSVKGVTFNVPRSSNPFPVSGSIVRVDSVHVSITKATQTETKDILRVVEVDFPADAQGNVVLKVNAKTCTLNLVTHAVANCH